MEQLASVDGLCEGVSKALGVADATSTYNVNLSVFTSIPDFWGIEQLFPIEPISKLEQQPRVTSKLSDLTCDSDGRAYEEALGGVHNLFGGPIVVQVVQSDGPQSFAITRAQPDPSCSDVLRAMQHEPELMFQSLKHRAEECLHHKEEYTVASLANGLARSFNNMPYLVPGSTLGSCGLVDSNGYRAYVDGADDGCNASVVDAVPGEDEQWSYVCLVSLIAVIYR